MKKSIVYTLQSVKHSSYISIKKARDIPGLFYGAFFMGDVCGLSAHQDMPDDMDSKIAEAKSAAHSAQIALTSKNDVRKSGAVWVSAVSASVQWGVETVGLL